MQNWNFTAISDLCSASNYDNSELAALLPSDVMLKNGGSEKRDCFSTIIMALTEWNRFFCQSGEIVRMPNGPISVHIRHTRVCLMWNLAEKRSENG